MWHLTFLFMCAVPTAGRQSQAADIASDAPDPDYSAGGAVLPLHWGVLPPPPSSQQPLGFPSPRVRFRLQPSAAKLHPVINSLHCGCSQPCLNHMYSSFRKIRSLFFVQISTHEKWEIYMADNACILLSPVTVTSSVQRASAPQQRSCRLCTNSSRTSSRDFEASPGGCSKLGAASDVMKILIFEREVHCNVVLLKYWESSITRRKGGEKELLWCDVGWLTCSYGSWTDWRVSTADFLCVARENKAEAETSVCSLAWED